MRVGFVGRLLVNIAEYWHKPTPTDLDLNLIDAWLQIVQPQH